MSKKTMTEELPKEFESYDGVIDALVQVISRGCPDSHIIKILFC